MNLVNSADGVSVSLVRNLSVIRGMGEVSRPCGGTGEGFRPSSAVVSINKRGVNNKGFRCFTNPYSIRDHRRVVSVTGSIGGTNTGVLENNTFGPHASPCTFRKVHTRKLRLLLRTGGRANVPVIARVVSTSRVSLFRGISVVRIKTEGVRGFRLLGRLNEVSGPVFLGHKLYTALRRFLVDTRCVVTRNGRGIVLYRHNVEAFRATAEGALSLSTITVLRRVARLPMMISPDRTSNVTELMGPVSFTTTTYNTSNLVVRIRGSPTGTLYSNPRTLHPRRFTRMAENIGTVERAMGGLWF